MVSQLGVMGHSGTRLIVLVSFALECIVLGRGVATSKAIECKGVGLGAILCSKLGLYLSTVHEYILRARRLHCLLSFLFMLNALSSKLAMAG